MASLTVDDRIITDWQEAVEEEIDLVDVPLADLIAHGRDIPLEFPASHSTEPITDKAGTVVGRLNRETAPITCVARVSAEQDDSPFSIVKVRVVIENLTDWAQAGAAREEFVKYCMAAVHTLLTVRDGSFLSLADPPEFAKFAAAACVNSGTWPCLIGDEDHRDTILSSPITLSDYPEIAPESEGDFYDATEVDEMLHLFVNTLTEEERAEARGTDPRSAAIMDRVENMPPEMMEKLHGAIRSLRSIPLPGNAVGSTTTTKTTTRKTTTRSTPGWAWATWPPSGATSVTSGCRLWGRRRLPHLQHRRRRPHRQRPPRRRDRRPLQAVRGHHQAGGVQVGKGAKVILRPGNRSDAQDMFLVGLTATVEGVFHDIDGDIHLAVSVDDDPAATELPSWIGRFRYFRIHEVEVLSQ